MWCFFEGPNTRCRRHANHKSARRSAKVQHLALDDVSARSLSFRATVRPPPASHTHFRTHFLRAVMSWFSSAPSAQVAEGKDKSPVNGDKKNLKVLRAVKDGKTSALKTILESEEADVNFSNHYGDTALILAAWYGHVDITRLLLDARADVDAINCDGNCALNCAAYHGFFDVAEMLVNAGCQIDVRDNVTGKTALIKAAYVGHGEVAEMLIRAGAERNAMDNQGYTAVAFSCSFNHLEILDVLLRAKADPNVQVRHCTHAHAHTHSSKRLTPSPPVLSHRPPSSLSLDRTSLGSRR